MGGTTCSPPGTAPIAKQGYILLKTGFTTIRRPFHHGSPLPGRADAPARAAAARAAAGHRPGHRPGSMGCTRPNGASVAQSGLWDEVVSS